MLPVMLSSTRHILMYSEFLAKESSLMSPVSARTSTCIGKVGLAFANDSRPRAAKAQANVIPALPPLLYLPRTTAHRS